MKLNHPLFAQLRDATQRLLTRGPGAATAAIQHALDSLRGGPRAPRGGPPMHDIHPAPERPEPETAPAESHAEARAARGDAPTGVPNPATHPAEYAQDLLQRMGIQVDLQGMPNGGAAGAPQGLQGLDLPRFDFSRLDLPAYDAPRRAPADLPPGARFIEGSYSNHAGSRNYKLYIPSCFKGKALPLMVMLHGCTQDPDDFAAGTRMNEVAEEKHCFVLYPEQTRKANNARCWNWFNALDQRHGQGEPSLIAGITRQVMEQYPVPPHQVYVAGLSAGGAMAMIVGTLYPELYAAVGVHSGLPFAAAQDLPSALTAMKRGARADKDGGGGLPIIVFHGDRDTTVHPRNGEVVLTQRLNGHAGDSKPSVKEGSVPDGHRYTRTTHHHPDGTTLAEHWLVHGAGHAWSGGSAQGSYADQKGPDASREMMRFFRTVS